jgi:hypothetical protein
MPPGRGADPRLTVWSAGPRRVRSTLPRPDRPTTTDAHLHRMLPDDTPLARSITVLARAYQDAVWRRTKLVQELREYYPGFLAVFAAGAGSGRGLSTTQLASTDARAVLAIAPGPADGLTVSTTPVTHPRAATARAVAGYSRRRGGLRVPHAASTHSGCDRVTPLTPRRRPQPPSRPQRW